MIHPFIFILMILMMMMMMMKLLMMAEGALDVQAKEFHLRVTYTIRCSRDSNKRPLFLGASDSGFGHSRTKGFSL